jgi:hypothetical protein
MPQLVGEGWFKSLEVQEFPGQSGTNPFSMPACCLVQKKVAGNTIGFLQPYIITFNQAFINSSGQNQRLA